MTARKRRKSFVDYQIQFALTRRVLFHWCLFWLASCVVNLTFKLILNPSSGLAENCRLFWTEHGPFLMVALLMLPIFALDTVKFSNRFAGPMVRLRQAMREITRGESVAPIKFRPGDFWQDLAGDFNKLLKRVEIKRSAASDSDASAHGADADARANRELVTTH